MTTIAHVGRREFLAGLAAAGATALVPDALRGAQARPAAARALGRECNEYGARLMADRPGRFGMFATLDETQ